MYTPEEAAERQGRLRTETPERPGAASMGPRGSQPTATSGLRNGDNTVLQFLVSQVVALGHSSPDRLTCRLRGPGTCAQRARARCYALRSPS